MIGFSFRSSLVRSSLGRSVLPLFLTTLGAALLAGCGGGGGNGNTNPGGSTGTIGTNSGNNSGGVIGNAAVVGKVVTVTGDPVPAASVIPDTGGLIATSVSQGGYRLDGLTGDVVHRITAAVTVNGINYTGSTQVLTLSGNLISNANILVTQQGQQATLTGRVTDSTRLDSGGNPAPVFQARVFLVVPNSQNYSSLIAFTDSNGVYSIPNVPVNLPTTSPIKVAVSLERYDNQSFPIAGLQAGGTYSQNFSLTPSTNQSISTPNLQAVTASTQPSSVFSSSTGNLRPRTAQSGSVYEQIRRLLSPDYAKSIMGHQAATTRRLTAHLSGGFGSYAIETDVAFDTPDQFGSLFAYTVYRTTDGSLPNQSQTPYDILQDPLANFYTDLDTSYVPNNQYRFALSATNTDRTETPLSNTLSIVPLDQLFLTQPQTGQILANNVTLRWNLASGASKYFVFLYSGDQFPTITATPLYATPSATPIAGNVNTFTLPSALLGGRDYYAVVVGANDQTEGNDSSGAARKIENAATTFSQITKFRVQ